MTSVFISYRRNESSSLATLIARQLEEQNITAFIDTRKVDGGGPFPQRLRGAIDDADIFVCLLGATSLESTWVREEIKHAHTAGKVMIPVFQENYQRPQDIEDKHVMALLQSDGIHVFDIKNIYVDEAIEQLAKMIRISYKKQHPLRGWMQIISILLAVIAVMVGGILIVLTALRPEENGTPTPAQPVIAQQASHTATERPPSDTPHPSATPTITLTVTPASVPPTATLDPLQLTATQLIAGATQTAEARAIVTLDPLQLTATQLIAQYTQTRQAALTDVTPAAWVTPLPFEPPVTPAPYMLTATRIIADATGTISAHMTQTASVFGIGQPTADDFQLTATKIVADATASAQARATQQSGCLVQGDGDPLYGQLLFTRISQAPVRWRLIWCDLATGQERDLTPDGYHAAFGSWSPDGEQIVFLAAPETDRSMTWDIWLMDSDGDPDSLQNLTRSRALERAPAWSPLDTRITYTYQELASRESDIWYFDIANDTLGIWEELDVGLDGEAVLSSDEAQVAFTSNVDGQYDLYIYQRRTERLLRIDLPQTDEYYPHWSADNQELLYYSFEDNVGEGILYALNPQTCTAYGTQLRDCQPRQILANDRQYADTWPVWALDDKAIIFESDRWGVNKHIFIVPASGDGEPRRITNMPGVAERYPSWRP